MNEPFLMVDRLMKFWVLKFCGRFCLLIDEFNESYFEWEASLVDGINEQGSSMSV